MMVRDARKRTIVKLLCLGIALAIGVTAWLLWPRPNLGDRANYYAELLLNGDTDELWEHSIEKHRGDSGLTKYTFKQVYETTFAPRMAGWRVTGPFVRQSSEAQGLAQAQVTHANGAKFAIGWTVFNDGAGNGLIRLTDMLNKAWILEYLANGGDAEARDFRFEASRVGLLKDLEALRRLGLVGQTPVDPTAPVLPLDEWVSSQQEEAARIAAATDR